ncbi:MAG: SDR family oxidoreductase [Gemmatimonadaceae bacterium]
MVGQVRRRSGVTILDGLGAETIVTDLSDPSLLHRAMGGCDVVFHLAGYFDFWAPSNDVYQKVNIDAAKYSIAAAIVAKVPRVVYCSSALTIGEEPGDEGHENTSHRGYTLTEFERSKLAAERLVLKLRAKGLDVVVVNPALVVAPNDTGWTGRLISDCVSGRARYIGDAPVGWVWVEDAATSLLAAYSRGIDGERYIVCAETLTERQFLGRVANQAGRVTPRGGANWLVKGAAVVDGAVSAALRRRPSFPRDEERFATAGFRVDGAHAAQKLGLTYTASAAYLPALVQSYQKALARFA